MLIFKNVPSANEDELMELIYVIILHVCDTQLLQHIRSDKLEHSEKSEHATKNPSFS